MSRVYRTRASSVSALSGVTAQIPAEAVTVVAGPSGSGKSTLLRLFAGMGRPDSGRLVVGDVRVDLASSRVLRGLRRRTVGFVFQLPSDNFLPHLTVGEHLSMAARASERRVAEPEDLADVLEIAHRLGHRPAELSGGEQARAAMAQVLLGGRSIVVADEPTAALDTASSSSLLDAMGRLVDRGVTFILSSHDPQVIRRSGHLVELEHGLVRAKTRAGREHFAAGAARAWGRPPSAPIEREGSDIVRLHARSVGKTYRRGSEEVHAVRDASFDVLGGELVGLVGRSGSGKTTLVNIAAGWERPDRGQLSVVGKDPARSVPSWDEVAVLPQQLGMIGELTIRENVEYPARLAGRLPELSWFIDELIDALGLRPLQDRYPKEASVGEQQRAGLARPLVLSPRLLLADEPTGHQNAEWAETMFRSLREATSKDTACLAASHDESVLAYVDRILGMSDGVLEALPTGA